jgi:hypothetical protein
LILVTLLATLIALPASVSRKMYAESGIALYSTGRIGFLQLESKKRTRSLVNPDSGVILLLQPGQIDKRRESCARDSDWLSF